MASTSSPLPLYPKGSRAWKWQRLGAAIGAGMLAYTIYAILAAKPCVPPLRLFYLALLWGVWPPAWWWYEYFVIFPNFYTPEKFEAFKHGAQASLAIWAPIAVGLFAYASSDRFKVPVPPAECFASKKAAAGVQKAIDSGDGRANRSSTVFDSRDSRLLSGRI